MSVKDNKGQSFDLQQREPAQGIVVRDFALEARRYTSNLVSCRRKLSDFVSVRLRERVSKRNVTLRASSTPLCQKRRASQDYI